jgi:hypothetical protein
MSRSQSGVAEACANGVKLSGNREQPELDHGQWRQPGRLAAFAGLVPAAGPLGLAGVAAAGPLGHQAAAEGDLEVQVGEGLVKLLRGGKTPGR